MARPIRDNLLSFEHDSDAFEHPKFMALRARFGWEGDGRFWALNSIIAHSNGCRLDISRPFVKAGIVQKLGMTEQDFDAFVAFLVDPQLCGLIQSEHGTLWTDRTQGELKRAAWWRESDRQRKEAERETAVRRKTTIVRPLSGGKPELSGGSPAENPSNPPDKTRKTGFSGLPSCPVPSGTVLSGTVPSGPVLPASKSVDGNGAATTLTGGGSMPFAPEKKAAPIEKGSTLRGADSTVAQLAEREAENERLRSEREDPAAQRAVKIAAAKMRQENHRPLSAEDRDLLGLLSTVGSAAPAPVDDFPDDPLPGPQPEFPEATS
jgi:hypothetical protein